MEIPTTGTELLRQLAATPDAPEPLAPCSDVGEPYHGPHDPSYDREPPDPLQVAIRLAEEAVAQQARAREAHLRALVRAEQQRQRDLRTLAQLLTSPTPEELAARPVPPCEPGRPLRFDYRGPMGGV
jgi:hypothetical protein